MARFTRTTRLVAVAAGALALTAPAAQAKFIDPPTPMAHTTAQRVQQLSPDRADGIGTSRQKVEGTSAVATASGNGFNWGDASIGAALATVLVGLGITGVRLGQRRTAQA